MKMYLVRCISVFMLAGDEFTNIIAANIKRIYSFTLFSIIFISNISLHAQVKPELTDADKSSLEAIIVEKYYVSDSTDAADTLGGLLAVGSTTYRIYIDMKPGYVLQAVYGNQKHELRIQTTTKFYNNTYCGALIGYNVNPLKVNKGNYALDSWITINSATTNHAGVLLSEDKDGSIIKIKQALSKADGLTDGNLPLIKPFNMGSFSCFKDANASLFSTRNGGWGALSGFKAGSKGPTDANQVLIAQLTTTGNLSFELNIQIGTPSGGTVNYVAKNPEGSEIKFDALYRK